MCQVYPGLLKLFRLSTFIRMQEPCGCPVAFSNVNVREASWFNAKVVAQHLAIASASEHF